MSILNLGLLFMIGGGCVLQMFNINALDLSIREILRLFGSGLKDSNRAVAW